MSWDRGALRWPASADTLHTRAQEVLGQLPVSQESAMGRLQGLAARAQYQRHPLSEAAEGLVTLRTELDRLLVSGYCLAVTPYQHGVGQPQGNQHHLSAPNAVAALAAKLQDGADPRLPTGQLHALAWLVTGNSAEDLARQLAPLCALLPLPEWCATLRRLTASNDTMHQPTAVKVPRWRSGEPLCWAPLRPARAAIGAELAQLESLARDSQSPIDKLQGLAVRRTSRLANLAEALAELGTLSGTLWHWQGQGDAASLAPPTRAEHAPRPQHEHDGRRSAALPFPAHLLAGVDPMSQAMLTLDGEPITMKSMRVSASMQFQDKDQSGQTSSTSSAEQGAKAKELDVSGLIPFKEERMLSRLFELADAKENGGQRHIYRVGSLLAKSVKVRQARFAGRITASEQEGLLAWQVQFTLKEFNSVPEKREQRLPKQAPTVGQGTANTTAAKPGSKGTGDEAPELSSFERYVLQPMDDMLA